MEVEPRSRAMRRAKEDARRKRRTTVIDSSQCQSSPGPGALVLRQLHGVPARRAAPRHSPKVSTARWRTVLQGGLAVVVSPSLRQSGYLFRKLARHLVASGAAFRRETMTEVELVSGGLAVSLPGDRPAMLRGLSLRHDGPAVLIVDEASRAVMSFGRRSR